MRKRPDRKTTGLAFPEPYSQVVDQVPRIQDLADLLGNSFSGQFNQSGLVAEKVYVKVRIVRNGWLVEDTVGNQYFYTDPTDVLYAVSRHLEFPPVNPLSVLPDP